ncbi:MAG: O-antigen ligase family protein [Pirellulales bacterium]|nr:O-antigen ligase family protein [Pirellulales bacterium]
MNSAYLPSYRTLPGMPTHGAKPASLFSQGGIAACLLGVASGIPVQAIGRLYIGELLLMAIAPVVVLLLLGLSDQYGKTARTILVAMAISWAGYVISDIIRGTPSHDYLRGWSRWIAMGASFATLAWLGSKNIGYLTSFLFGLAIGTCLSPFVMGGAFGIKLYWKFYAGFPICIMALLVTSRMRPWISCATLLGLAVLSVALDFRSLALLCILASGISWLAMRRVASQRRTQRPISKTSMIAAAAAIFVIIALAISFIQLLGERYGYADRFKRSNATRMISATVTWAAIKESPFIGYGSWPRDAELARLRDQLVSKAKGSAAFRMESQDDLIIAHSQILQGWLEGGLLGLCFFAWLGWQLVRQLTWQALVSPFLTLTPLIVFMQLNCAWHLVFSPFSGSQRVYIPATCVLICYVAMKSRELKQSYSQNAFVFATPRFAGAT